MWNEFHTYWLEFLTIASVHLLAVASPGPDFAVVVRHSVSFGRRIAIITSLGIGIAILLHVAYSMLGIGLLIQTTPWLFNVLSYLAAIYLGYLGIMALKSRPNPPDLPRDQKNETVRELSDRKAFIIGFVTNGLNPKATLFFLSLFAVAISAQTPFEVKLFYGAYLALATTLWFVSLSCLLSTPRIREFLTQQGYWFDRLMGLLLIALALRLVFPGES
ncbi:LysE family translocator [Lacimicrobium alkaliphilum]|uniref:Lysine transporter LysE n=1 Tax=Lacimicrobium alkaliphilum TaxID=1526571 RepID=A0ABQ1QZD7_9ALTE|nr:LysE family translocator [Lacimicrobium alkaliphilum]GGD52727.1 lysine transporter LysE [Lacimicrobium alkaliphilum]